MRLIFAGTPQFAQVALESLQRAGHEIVLVLTQPDRPAGRGMKLQASPVKQYALHNAIALAQPRSLRLDGKYPQDALAAKACIDSARADAMIVAAYGLLLPQWVLDAPRLGCLNIHASVLPRWRGAAPIHRAIEAGDAISGITIMQMDAGLDTGDMLLAQTLTVAKDDTTASLHDKLAALGGEMIVQALGRVASGQLSRTPQPNSGITYAHKISKAESAIDWQDDAQLIARRIRAFSPVPGCTAQIRGETIKLCLAQAIRIDEPAYASEAQGLGGAGVMNAMNAMHALSGSVLRVSAQAVDVACGNRSVLRVTQLQRPGGKRLAVAEFLRGFKLVAGERFE